jgi:hypothetical protein
MSQMRDKPDVPEGPSRRALVVTLAFVVVLAIGGYYLVQAFVDMVHVQNCLASGRHDC